MSTDSARSADEKKPLGKNTHLAVSGCENERVASDDELRRAATTLRYDLQETAQTILRKEPEGKRLKACMVVHVDSFTQGVPDEAQSEVVVVERDAKMSRARYKNLVHCNSPWVCPICSASRTEKDKLEVNTAYLAARAKGWTVFMVTYTQRHTFGDVLKSLLEINAEARRWVKSGSRLSGVNWGDLKAKYGLQGGIINLEVTHGANAWHPHNHELIFVDPAVAESDDIDELRWELARRWQAAVKKQGGDCDIYHGLDLKRGDDAIASYIAKFGHEPKGGWSIASEITKGASKVGKAKGRTPFQLLYDYRFEGDRQAGRLFIEFAREFSGKAHIRWSQGLRAALDIDNFELPRTDADEQRIADEKPCYQPMLALPVTAWRRHILSRYGRRAEFIIACEQGEIEASECLARWGYTGKIFWLDTVTAKSAMGKWLENYNTTQTKIEQSDLPQQAKF